MNWPSLFSIPLITKEVEVQCMIIDIIICICKVGLVYYIKLTVFVSDYYKYAEMNFM